MLSEQNLKKIFAGYIVEETLQMSTADRSSLWHITEKNTPEE